MASPHADDARGDGAAWPVPLRLGFEDEPIGDGRHTWFVPTDGWAAELVEGAAPSGAKFLKLHVPTASTAPMGNVMTRFDATPYRGLRVALRSKMRVEGRGRGQMWLRVDRPNGQMGGFDNMGDRPIIGTIADANAGGVAAQWQSAAIELDVDDDATWLNVGWMSLGGSAAVLVDDAELVVIGESFPHQAPSPPRALDSRGLENLRAATKLLGYVRFFHPSDQAVAVKDWNRFAVSLVEQAEPAPDAADLARRLAEAFAPLAPAVQVWAGGANDAPPLPAPPDAAREIVSWRHLGIGGLPGAIPGNAYKSTIEHTALTAPIDTALFDGSFVVKPLGGGVSCRIPIRLFADERGTLPHRSPQGAAPDAAPGPAPILTSLNRSTRLADVAIAWTILQHFYPYFDVVGTDWDAALSTALTHAAEDADESAFGRTLSVLVAQLRDGHGSVRGLGGPRSAPLPLQFVWAGADLVVIGRSLDGPAEIAIGDALVAVDDQSLASCLAELSTRVSAATDGWRRYKLAGMLAYELPAGDPASLRLRRPDGTEYTVQVARRVVHEVVDAMAKRPPNGAEVAPGIVYFDLNGTDGPALVEAMPKLESARGMVFDMRGYPSQAAYALIGHLIDETATSARWNIALTTRPDREGVTWVESGRWIMPPEAPRLRQPIAFLTDGRAISYAESIMGIVEAYRLGEIVGSTTAGTNGNVNPFDLAGGYRVWWTGMKVLKHDGTQHHGVGIAPTVPVEPTARGIADGRDEVLERGIEVVRAKIAAAGGL
ncbi:MAG: S41 family peptidase [Phycisphaerales bacterium]